MKQITLLITALFLSASAIADWGYYQLPITRNGQTKTMLAYNNWSGEYPNPVIDVPNNLTVTGYKSLRTMKETQDCNIKKGLYHPWGDSPSALNLYTITDVLKYTATESVPVEEMYNYDKDGNSIEITQINKGEVLTNVIYLSEGWCSADLISQKEKINVEFFCDSTLDKKGLKNNDPTASLQNSEQWVHLKCLNGGSVFVMDKDFLSQPGVQQGQISGYGEVQPGN